MIEELRNKARELLKTNKVDVIIGYERAPDGISAKPCFVEKEEDIENLIWDAYCVYNLSNHLKDFSGKRIGIVAKACDIKSIKVLLQENQLKRQEIFIIGVECSGIIDEKRLLLTDKQTQEAGFVEKCIGCKPSLPDFSDILIKKV